ncbi:SipW-dependent-type signal peptide-containing protein [Microbacterium immunditiarum]|uniref:Putative ribosomally synthesized peptide with SipW-like signal peptide n=1 Tax=Microbacterium immunditiarum TaxID=337480 RepID=A0A7Y9GPE9_9MICO|nr:SipW-dependent-type signal peptide-containing protein [Microbacterium immunditiarum]NYE20248.1 putative ribosomally synthesized peptide with SipW-like signal peptide [Microbacterium immunditiarum]
MTTTTQKDRRGAMLRASIAAVAVLGIGGAITTAAWTDQVTFAGDVQSAKFDLRGAVQGGAWYDGPIDLGDAFKNLQPGDVTKTIALKNNSTVNAYLGESVLEVDPALNGAITHSVENLPASLAPNGYVNIKVTFHVADDLPMSTAGKLQLTFPASSAR